MNGSIRAKLNLLTVVDSVPGTTTTRTHFLLTTSRRSTFPRVIILNLATIKKNKKKSFNRTKTLCLLFE